MDISQKDNWSEVYVRPTPSSYLQMVSQKEYGVPDYALQYLRPLLKMLHAKRKRPVNIVDMGASYGIISTLLLHELTMAQLVDFFVENKRDRKRTWEEIERFYRHQDVRHTEYNFYLSDNSKPAMDFSKQFRLCKDAYCFDMKKDPLPEKFKQIVEKIDLFIAIGSLAYIGEYFFHQIFPILSSQSRTPLFAFVVYRAFYSSEIEKIFQDFNYVLLKSNIPFKKGRKFSSILEQKTTIASLHQRNINTVSFEDEGYYACEFYLGVSASEKEKLNCWLEDLSR